MREIVTDNFLKKLKQTSWNLFYAFITFLVIIFLFVGGKMLYQIFSQDHEIVIWNGKFPTIIECSYPLGSILNKDEICFRKSEAIIFKRYFWGDDVITLPYTKIKETIFREGFYWKSITVKREGFLGKGDNTLF